MGAKLPMIPIKYLMITYSGLLPANDLHTLTYMYSLLFNAEGGVGGRSVSTVCCVYFRMQYNNRVYMRS